MTAKEIELRDEIVEYFMTMNSVPLPSRHKEKIGDIIYKAGNLIIDIPGTNASTEEPKILM